MVYSALNLMEKANQIYEMDELPFSDQLGSLLLWTAEFCLIVAAVVLYF